MLGGWIERWVARHTYRGVAKALQAFDPANAPPLPGEEEFIAMVFEDAPPPAPVAAAAVLKPVLPVGPHPVPPLPGKKRGRPTNEEVARRAAESGHAAEGE